MEAGLKSRRTRWGIRVLAIGFAALILVGGGVALYLLFTISPASFCFPRAPMRTDLGLHDEPRADYAPARQASHR